ncbi:hypothetical protein BH11PAT1_BH11PAT1_7810 [soil metagenome]
MKVITLHKEQFLLRFDRGESVWEKLTEFVVEKKVASGIFSAIGACQEVTLSFYDLVKKEYRDTLVSEDLEILTITGNIAQMNQTAIIHAHGSFGKEDLSVIGGHIKTLIVSATCELILTAFEKKLERAYDETTGLNLLK